MLNRPGTKGVMFPLMPLAFWQLFVGRLIPDGIIPVFLVQFGQILRIDMPEGLINFGVAVTFFFLMGERTPPVFNNFNHIGMPFKKCNTNRAIPGAV